jgi:hypothetical protein
LVLERKFYILIGFSQSKCSFAKIGATRASIPH